MSLTIKPSTRRALHACGYTTQDVQNGITKEMKNDLIEQGFCSSKGISNDEGHNALMLLRTLHDNGGNTMATAQHLSQVNDPVAVGRMNRQGGENIDTHLAQQQRNYQVKKNVEANVHAERMKPQRNPNGLLVQSDNVSKLGKTILPNGRLVDPVAVGGQGAGDFSPSDTGMQQGSGLFD